MNTAPNNFVQATAGFAILWLPSRMSGAPDDKRWLTA